ncbi:MAG TPA: MarR family winged helix-turn-helix transcriptional regulator [Amnibacterium sp.]|jgi:DNA-binding MarR family transcriptional regulator
MAEQLTQGEASTWRFIQKLTELAQGVVESEIRAAADLSTSEFEVLRCLLDSPERQLRQNELAGQLGWDKSRLSHQLTRMEHRELIERRKAGRIHAVTLTRLGQQKFELAGLAHVAAVRTLLVEHLSSEEREALLRTAVLQAEEAAAAAQPPAEAPVKAQAKSGTAPKRVLRPRVG